VFASLRHERGASLNAQLVVLSLGKEPKGLPLHQWLGHRCQVCTVARCERSFLIDSHINLSLERCVQTVIPSHFLACASMDDHIIRCLCRSLYHLQSPLLTYFDQTSSLPCEKILVSYQCSQLYLQAHPTYTPKIPFFRCFMTRWRLRISTPPNSDSVGIPFPRSFLCGACATTLTVFQL